MSSQLGREILRIVEIDQDFCAETFGVAPCVATVGPGTSVKCWNTFATCTDQANYNLSSLTLRFSEAQTAIVSEYTIPSLISISKTSTVLNIGSRSGDNKPMGKRASATIQFQDMPFSDNVVDPYLSDRSYIASDQGTFWSKWLVRNPFYNGRPLRVLEGFVGDTLAEMTTRHYVIDSIDGPNSQGQVTIKALDVLRLADDTKAQAPSLSSGELNAAITDAATSLVVTAGVLADYDSDKIRIGDELIDYTGTSESLGLITFTGLTRGVDDTTAEAHNAGDTVQNCLVYTAQECWLVAQDLLENYGNINPSFIPISDWNDEGNTWLGAFDVSRIISEPTGVTTLLGSLTKSCLFYLWWDEVAQEVKLKAIRPETGTLTAITEDNALVQNKTSIKVAPHERASEVWVHYAIKSPIDSSSSADSYKKVRARIDATAESSFEYDERVVYPVFSPWLTTDAQASTLGFRLLARYRDNPKTISFTTDIKDRLDLAQVVNINYNGLVDVEGNNVNTPFQVISAKDKGDIIEYSAIEYIFTSRYGFYMATGTPDYSGASNEQKQTGAFYGPIAGAESYRYI